MRQTYESCIPSGRPETLITVKQQSAYCWQAFRLARCLLASVILSLLATLPSLAQTSGGDAPVKWPDQAECRLLMKSGQNTANSNAADPVINGWCIAIDDRRGNCIACHTFNISPWPVRLPIAGNLAPPMVAMKARFPDSATLRAIIEDSSAFNARSAMPPYLTHQILTPDEIDMVITFLGTL